MSGPYLVLIQTNYFFKKELYFECLRTYLNKFLGKYRMSQLGQEEIRSLNASVHVEKQQGVLNGQGPVSRSTDALTKAGTSEVTHPVGSRARFTRRPGPEACTLPETQRCFLTRP